MLSIVLACAPFASAFAGPAEDKATARELAKEGIAAGQAGDCATATDRLERAESLFHAPPHLQHLARCYTKVGRLVDATETWRKLTLETPSPTAPQVFKDAYAEASEELPKLEPRLARLTLKTTATYPGLAVEVDGKTWPTAAIGVPRVMDPGKHVIRASATGFKTSEQTLTLAEGKSEAMTIALEQGSSDVVGPAPSASASVSATTVAPTGSTTADQPPPSRSPLRSIGVVTTGVGVALVVGGVFTGLAANSRFNDLEQQCPDRSRCTLGDLDDRKQSIKNLELTTNILLIGGGVLAVTGITLFVLGASRPGSSKAGSSSGVSLRVAPSPGGGHVAVTGSF